MGKKNKKFYAVSVGVKVGIYTSWEDAHENIDGYRGACYKGYQTLSEAKAHMRIKGHDNPTLFNHNSRQCSSDTELDVELSLANALPAETATNRKVLVLDNNDSTDSGRVYDNSPPLRCSSDTDFVISYSQRYQSFDNDFELSWLNDIQFSQSDSTDVFENPALINATCETCQTTNANTEILTEYVSSIPVSTQTEPLSLSSLGTQTESEVLCPTSNISQTCMSQDILKSLVHQVSCLNDEVKAQHTCLQNFSLSFQKLLEEQVMLSQQLIKQRDDHSNLAQSLNEKIKDQNSLSEKLMLQVSDIHHQVDRQCQLLLSSNQKSVNSLQQSLDLPITTVNQEEKSKSMLSISTQESLPQSLDMSNLQSKASSQKSDTNFPSPFSKPNIDPLSQPKPRPSCNVSTGHNHQLPRGETSSNACMSISSSAAKADMLDGSTLNDCAETNKDTKNNNVALEAEEDTDILCHHPLHVLQSKTKDERRTIPQINLPSDCTQLLIGDSNLKTVNKKRLDSSGNTEIRTFHNVSIIQMQTIMNATERVFPKVVKVCICVGSTDCIGSEINHPNHIKSNMSDLLAATKKVFPNALLSVLAIPPQRSADANLLIGKINRGLKFLLRKSPVRFLNCDDLWAHVDGDGNVEKGVHLYKQLSNKGVALLLRQVLAFMNQFKGRQRNTLQGEVINQHPPNGQTYSNYNISKSPQISTRTQNCTSSTTPNHSGLLPFKFPDGKIVFFPFPPTTNENASAISTNSKVSWV